MQLDAATVTDADRYRMVGPAYDALAVIASGSAIHRCRLASVDHIHPGDRVLFVGPGHGTDVAAAAITGARVTVVERSATMLASLQRTLRQRGVDTAVDVLHGDAFDHDGGGYDVVVANFFLNVFDQDDEARMIRHLVGRLQPGGTLVVGDFACVIEPGWLRVVTTLHWYVAVVVFSILTGNAIRPMTNHAARATEHGLRVLSTTTFNAWGLPLYASTAMVRDA